MVPLPLGEEDFRALLDERGILQPTHAQALGAPRDAAYAVFSQRPDAMLDIGGLRHNGEQFFSTKIGITVEKSYAAPLPRTDAARIVIASADPKISGTRLAIGRPVDAADLAQAEQAERASRGHGLALLAKRCPTLWLVLPTGPDDRVALAICAILASVFLGPILFPGGEKIVGVRSARLELERPLPA